MMFTLREGLHYHAHTHIRHALAGRKQPAITRKTLTAEKKVGPVGRATHSLIIGPDSKDPAFGGMPEAMEEACNG